MDAGYNTAYNLDLFYTEDHKCVIDYVTRVKSNDKQLKEMIAENLPGIGQYENFVDYENRFLFIVKKQIFVGVHADNPAWLYLGLDFNRLTDEGHKLVKRAQKNKMSLEEIYEAIHTEGLFGLVSSKEYPCDEILPIYYQRQTAEQTFDFLKNYTKVLPLRTNCEETFRGHLLLSYMASCAVKLVQLQLAKSGVPLGRNLLLMRNQKCSVYSNRIVTANQTADQSKMYQALGVKAPSIIPIVDGVMQYTPPAPHVQKAEKPGDQRTKTSAAKAKTSKKAAGNDKQSSNPTPKKRGRPEGSKNKKTIEREEQMRAEEAAKPKRGPGRPKGSKNKKTIERERRLARAAAADTKN